ncbi:MAG: redoxin domain-containing protein [Bacteroidota bacterium]
MKNLLKYLFLLLFLTHFAKADDYPTLAIGTKAPDFSLKGTDNKIYNLNSFATAKVLIVYFTCNHCPTAQAYEDRIQKIVNTYKAKGVQLVAIMPNDDKAVRFDELGYTDISDSFAEMKMRVKDKKYTYPYLYDGATQTTAQKYGAVATPHAYVFDKARKLQYVGRIDDNEHIGKETTHELVDAIESVLKGEPVAKPVTKTFGCSVKWASKSATLITEAEKWAKEPVSLERASMDKLKELMENKGTGKYRLLNVWATWCGPCVAEFSSLVETNHMYRRRDFEFVTLSADDPKNYDKTLKFLKEKMSSSPNYIFDGGTKYQMIEAVDPAWQGALPYTVLIAPEGKIVYKQMGMIDILKLRKATIEHIGRYYD